MCVLCSNSIYAVGKHFAHSNCTRKHLLEGPQLRRSLPPIYYTRTRTHQFGGPRAPGTLGRRQSAYVLQLVFENSSLAGPALKKPCESILNTTFALENMSLECPELQQVSGRPQETTTTPADRDHQDIIQRARGDHQKTTHDEDIRRPPSDHKEITKATGDQISRRERRGHQKRWRARRHRFATSIGGSSSSTRSPKY